MDCLVLQAKYGWQHEAKPTIIRKKIFYFLEGIFLRAATNKCETKYTNKKRRNFP